MKRKTDDRISTTRTHLELEEFYLLFSPLSSGFWPHHATKTAVTEVNSSPSLGISGFQNAPLSCFSSHLSDHPSSGLCVGSPSSPTMEEFPTVLCLHWFSLSTLYLAELSFHVNSCHLYWVEERHPQSHFFLQLQDVTLFGNRVVAAIIS